MELYGAYAVVQGVMLARYTSPLEVAYWYFFQSIIWYVIQSIIIELCSQIACRSDHTLAFVVATCLYYYVRGLFHMK